MNSIVIFTRKATRSLQWRHNKRDGISNHRRFHCLLNWWFMRRSKKTSKFRVTGFVRGIHRWPMDSPHKRPVTRKIFPFDDVIMIWVFFCHVRFRYIQRHNADKYYPPTTVTGPALQWLTLLTDYTAIMCQNRTRFGTIPLLIRSMLSWFQGTANH